MSRSEIGTGANHGVSGGLRLTVRACCAVSLLSLALAGSAAEPDAKALAKVGESFDQFRASVRSVIKDPAKADESVVLLDELAALLKEASAEREAFVAEIAELNASYDATGDDFRAAYREHRARQVDRQQRLVAINQRAKELTTPEEWKALGKAHDKLLKSILGSQD